MTTLSGKVVEIRPSFDADAARKIGESLKQMRKLSDLTQTEMAQRLNVGQAAVSKIEAGRSDLHISTVQKFVEALGATLRVGAAFPPDTPFSLYMRDAFDVEFDHEDQLVLPIFGDIPFRLNRDVVLSIRPRFSARILAGEKTVELRRRFPVSAPKGTIAYIYSTSPVRAMEGAAEIAGVRKLSVPEIWRRYSSVAFLEKSEFDSYFKGLEQGFALEFENVKPFSKPISLAELRERFEFEPPQSYLYAKQNLRRALKDEYNVVSD